MLKLIKFFSVFVLLIITKTAAADPYFTLPTQIVCTASGSNVTCTPTLDSTFIKLLTTPPTAGTYYLNSASDHTDPLGITHHVRGVYTALLGSPSFTFSGVGEWIGGNLDSHWQDSNGDHDFQCLPPSLTANYCTLENYFGATANRRH